MTPSDNINVSVSSQLESLLIDANQMQQRQLQQLQPSHPVAPSNRSRFPLMPFIRDADLVPEDLDIGLKATFIVAYTAIIFLAAVCNGLMVLTVIVDRKLRTVTNTFMASLAVSDTLIALVSMPVQLWYYIENEWTVGESRCGPVQLASDVVV